MIESIFNSFGLLLSLDRLTGQAAVDSQRAAADMSAELLEPLSTSPDPGSHLSNDCSRCKGDVSTAH